MRVVTQQIVDEIIASLQPVAVGVIRSPIPRIAAADAPAAGIMVLSAAFLVPHDRVAEFQRALTALVDRHGREGRGFRFDFTGPWPPYHFARGDTGDR